MIEKLGFGRWLSASPILGRLPYNRFSMTFAIMCRIKQTFASCIFPCLRASCFNYFSIFFSSSLDGWCRTSAIFCFVSKIVISNINKMTTLLLAVKSQSENTYILFIGRVKSQPWLNRPLKGILPRSGLYRF